MFDIYLSERRDHLLVVPKGVSIPINEASAKWRKKKRGVAAVSDEIRLAVERDGYYSRRLRDHLKSNYRQ